MMRSAPHVVLPSARSPPKRRPPRPTVAMARSVGVIMSLALVVGFIFAAAWVVRRMPLGMGARGNGPLKVLAALPLGPQRTLGARPGARRGAADRREPGRRVQRRRAARVGDGRRATVARRTHFRFAGSTMIAFASLLAVSCCCSCCRGAACSAQSLPAVTVDRARRPAEQTYSLSIQVLALMTALTVLPALVLSMTAFTRIVIVLAILRQALGTPQTPPNQVLIGLSLFLTLFVMTPVMTRAYDEAVVPYMAGEQDAMTAATNALVPLREFMLDQVRETRPRACSPTSRATSRSWARRRCRSRC